MASNILLAVHCPGDQLNSTTKFYVLTRKTKSVSSGEDSYGIFGCRDLGDTEIEPCYISRTNSSTYPTINSKIYTDSALTTPFNGDGKQWRIQYNDGSVYICTISDVGVITNFYGCPPAIYDPVIRGPIVI